MRCAIDIHHFSHSIHLHYFFGLLNLTRSNYKPVTGQTNTGNKLPVHARVGDFLLIRAEFGIFSGNIFAVNLLPPCPEQLAACRALETSATN
jgi:hypothetical protein